MAHRDRKLLQRYSVYGSEQAFAQLVKHYRPLVHSICLHQTGLATLAEDACQIVFIILAKKSKSLQAREELKGWLIQTAKFVARDAARRERRRMLREQQMQQEMIHSGWLRPEPSAQIQLDDQPGIYSALASLKPTEQQIVWLRFYETKTFQEIGTATGLSEDAARMRISRSLQKMERRLTQGTKQQKEQETNMTNTTTLAAAIKLMKRKLKEDQKPEFVALLTEQTLLDALSTNISAYLSIVKHSAEATEYINTVIQPLLEKIAQEKTWPENAWLDAFYELKDSKGNIFRGLGLGMEIRTPNQKIAGFSLPIIDLWYGRWVEEC